MASGPLRRLPGCLSHQQDTLCEDDLLELAAFAGAYLSFHPDARFTGPPCRADWRFPAPEVLFEKGRPDVRSELFSLGVTLLVLWRGEAAGVPAGASVEYAQWALDGHPARAWRDVDDVRAPVRELVARCVERARPRRPHTTDDLRARLLEVWPDHRTDAFPPYLLRTQRLSPAAWLAAARALTWWQIAALGITVGGLLVWLRLYAGG